MKIQLVKRGNTWYFRAEPKTAREPTINQIRARVIFGEIAKGARGKKMSGTLPPAAELIRERMRGKEIGRTKRLKKWQKILIEEYNKMSDRDKVRYSRAMEVLLQW